MCRFIKCAHRSTDTRSPVTWKKQGRSWELMALKKVLYRLALLSQRTAPNSQTLVVLHCIWLSLLMKEPSVIPLHQGIEKTKLRARTTVLWRNSIRDINKQEDCVPVMPRTTEEWNQRATYTNRWHWALAHNLAVLHVCLDGAKYLFIRRIPSTTVTTEQLLS